MLSQLQITMKIKSGLKFSHVYGTRVHKFLRALGATSKYRGADKSLARPTSRCIFFYGENI
jgi:hypothetical protein